MGSDHPVNHVLLNVQLHILFLVDNQVRITTLKRIHPVLTPTVLSLLESVKSFFH
jgi:hypothetical protein